MSARNIMGSTFSDYVHKKEVITLSNFDISYKEGSKFFGERFKKNFKYSLLSKLIRFVYRLHSSHYTSYYMKYNIKSYDLQTLHLIKEKLRYGTSNYILDDYKLAFGYIFNFLSNKYLYALLKRFYFFFYFCFSIKYLFIFLRYKPKKVVFCHAHASQDKSILFLCKFLKIRSEGLIHSWDNPTSKLLIPFKFERLYCWNKILKKELINLYDYKSNEVKEIGIPQFDIYKDYINIDRNKFIMKLFKNRRKYLVSFFCPSPAFVKSQKEIVDNLIKILGNNKKVNLFIRLHPGNLPEWVKSKKYKKNNLVINQPSNFYLADLADLSNFNKVNDEDFISVLSSSDITINCFSTTSIDSIYFNTPNISICYDNKNIENFYNKIDFYYSWKHYDELLKTNAISVAESNENLKHLILRYLKNKNYKSLNRIKTKKKFIYNLNSDSGYKLAKFIFK